MRVKVYENHWLPKKLGYTAITLYPRIYMADSYGDATLNHVLNHEFIHVAQVREVGFVRFYVKYLLDYAVQLIKYRQTQVAYMHIPAEVAAYAHQNDTPVPANVKLVDGILQET